MWQRPEPDPCVLADAQPDSTIDGTIGGSVTSAAQSIRSAGRPTASPCTIMRSAQQQRLAFERDALPLDAAADAELKKIGIV